MDEALEQRLIDLETRAAHQETTLDDLNRLVYRQARTIEGLQRDLAQVAERLRELMEEREPG